MQTRKMRPSIASILLVAGFVSECRAGPEVLGDGLRRRAGKTSSIIQNGATSTHLELRNTAIPEAQLPTSTGLVCSTTTQRPTSVCSLSSSKQICIETSTPVAFCKPENVCFKNKANQDTCRLRNNNIAPAGIAFAVIVPLVIAIIAITLIVMRRRERKARERQRVIRTMETDALSYHGAVLPKFEKYERVGVRRHGMNAEDNSRLVDGGEVHPPPAYSIRSFDSGSSDQRNATTVLPKVIIIPRGDDGDNGDAQLRDSHEQMR